MQYRVVAFKFLVLYMVFEKEVRRNNCNNMLLHFFALQ